MSFKIPKRRLTTLRNARAENTALPSPTEDPKRLNINTGYSVQQSDTIIAVMGPTGTGKSTFVNKVAGRYATAVSDELSSCTQEIKAVDCELNGRKVVLVDTPGFDDTNLSDLDVLELIADWLRKTYKEGVELCGLLYFHRITDNRMAGSPRRLLETFQNICGEPAFRNVILTTTMWDEIDEEDGASREGELSKQYWKQMLAYGARSTRFLNTPESAWNVISLVSPTSKIPLLLQIEMVDEKKSLSQTSAGRSLFRWLSDMMAVIKNVVRDLRAKLKGTKRTDVLRKHSLKLKLDKLEKQGHGVDHLLQRYRGSQDTLVSFSPSLTGSISPPDCMSPPPSPCVENRDVSSNRVFLQSTVTALRIIAELAGLAPFPAVKNVVGLVLVIVECVETTGGVNDALMEVSRNASALASNVAEIAHENMNPAVLNCIHFFISDLTAISSTVKVVSARNTASKFLMSAADKQRVEDCNRRLIFACSSLGAQVAVHNSISNARLEAKLDYVISLLSGQTLHAQASNSLPTIAALAVRSNAVILSPH
ncbi:P-loop containing nucleoside triphosphate hydrolase protein [Crepidotus variabilis]|uniref:P-loop containing nucleoside triphosphate hydrolase protein n=1 Tax=Crepidotus variabilis TaxID=179855 RepID=A0A9P6JV49_9AGAR|nr:P-loop containing nucleoside triphosphate hydrolase protein [Crepidotus variabilis]